MYQNLLANAQVMTSDPVRAFSLSGTDKIYYLLEGGSDKARTFLNDVVKGDVIQIQGQVQEACKGKLNYYKVVVYQVVKLGPGSDVSTAKMNLIGNLGYDPALRSTAKGSPVCNMSACCDDVWFSVTAWGRTGEVSAQYLNKGSKAFFAGDLKPVNVYKTQSGEERIKAVVTAWTVKFLDSKPTAASAEVPEVQGEEIPF